MAKSKMSDQELASLNGAILQIIQEHPEKAQGETFRLALEQTGLGNKLACSSSNASIYIRKAKGEPTCRNQPPLSGEKPSDIILAAENQIAKALLALEAQRDEKMREVRDLDNLIARYKHFKKA